VSGPGDPITAFLARSGWGDASRQPIAGDASTRRYERLRRRGEGGAGETAILMRAAPDASFDAFLAVDELLAGLALSVPGIEAREPAHGLLLLEDFGDASFAALLDGGAAPEPLLDLAVDVLIHLHRRFRPELAAELSLPAYDAPAFLEQLALFPEQFLPTVLDGGALAEAGRSFTEAWSGLLGRACRVPSSLLLRDYHAGNLMRLERRDGVRGCGLLDFQDAGQGPITYDLVSLLEDARRDSPQGLRERGLNRYLAAFPDLDRATFDTSCAILATMRHFRVITVFTRLAGQGRDDYLAHLPRLWRLIGAHLAAPALAPLAEWSAEWLPDQTYGR
jgi:aminoglycoside/choline kinase family phosphotransferase